MEYVVQVITIIVYITVVIIVMYFCCTKCRHTHTIFKYCFPFLPISHIIRTSRHTDIFVEVTNVVLLLCGCLSLIPFIEFRIWNNSSSPDVLNV